MNADKSCPNTQAQNKSPQNDTITEKKAQAIRLIEYIECDVSLTFFRDQMSNHCVQLPINDHYEIWSIRSSEFKSWLYRLFRKKEGKGLSSEALTIAMRLIEAEMYLVEKQLIFNRVAWKEHELWYDLTDKKWRAVKITANYWSIVNNPSVLFKRYNHHKSQCEPIRHGDIRILLEFVNIRNKDQQLLLLVFLVSCFISDFPHPVLAIYGQQGSAKSGLCRILKKLIDPSFLETPHFPQDLPGFIQLLDHHWALFFDNISTLPHWMSDTLCKAVTGDGFTKRKLFTNDKDVIYAFMRCIGINGINQVINKPDLLERSILIELSRISEIERKPEKLIWEQFEKKKPAILGGIFNTLVETLRVVPKIRLQKHPRMADFAIWGCAIAQALGESQEAFLSAYANNMNHQNEQILGDSLVATVLRRFIEQKVQWSGTPTELFNTLTNLAQNQGINTDKEKSWPKAAHILVRRLNELKTNLTLDGIEIVTGIRGKQRIISVKKILGYSVESDVVS